MGPNICQCPSDYSGPQCLLREYLNHKDIWLQLHPISKVSRFGKGELKDWVSAPPALVIQLGNVTMMKKDFYTQLYLFLCFFFFFLKLCALLPVKTGEDVSMLTNARVLVGGRGLVAR